MTQGKLISAAEAHKYGILDKLFSTSKSTEDLIEAAIAYALTDEIQGTFSS